MTFLSGPTIRWLHIANTTRIFSPFSPPTTPAGCMSDGNRVVAGAPTPNVECPRLNNTISFSPYADQMLFFHTMKSDLPQKVFRRYIFWLEITSEERKWAVNEPIRSSEKCYYVDFELQKDVMDHIHGHRFVVLTALGHLERQQGYIGLCLSWLKSVICLWLNNPLIFAFPAFRLGAWHMKMVTRVSGIPSAAHFWRALCFAIYHVRYQPHHLNETFWTPSVCPLVNIALFFSSAISVNYSVLREAFGMIVSVLSEK